MLSAVLFGCSGVMTATHTQSDTEIVRYSETPPDSGYLKTWVLVATRDRAGNESQFLIPYMGKSTFLPAPGTICDVVYRYEDIDGLVGLQTRKIRAAKVVARFENIK